jgi:hypothetical protein
MLDVLLAYFHLICQHKFSQELLDKGYKNNSPKSKHRRKMHSNVRDGGEGGRYAVWSTGTPTAARRRPPD